MSIFLYFLYFLAYICRSRSAAAALPQPLFRSHSAAAALPQPLFRSRSSAAALPQPLCRSRSSAAALPQPLPCVSFFWAEAIRCRLSSAVLAALPPHFTAVPHSIYCFRSRADTARAALLTLSFCLYMAKCRVYVYLHVWA